jgi:hypothetical protein
MYRSMRPCAQICAPTTAIPIWTIIVPGSIVQLHRLLVRQAEDTQLLLTIVKLSPKNECMPLYYFLMPGCIVDDDGGLMEMLLIS